MARTTTSLVKLKSPTQIYQKGTSTDALLKRLKAVQKELSEMEQERVDTNSLTPLCKELLADGIWSSKGAAGGKASIAVKASAACCLADLLRLYAPKAPFTAPELNKIFTSFISLLTGKNSGLARTASPEYADCFYLLESLSNVKSITLVTDLTGADQMTEDVFKGFFELVKPETTKNVEICMADIMVQLIDECITLPQRVLELLLEKFKSGEQKSRPAAHQLAIDVCDATQDRLQKHVAQHLSEKIVEASGEEDQEERETELRRWHSLIIQINKAVPAMLLNVIPQLEEELRTEDLMVRQIATKTLSQMFAEKAAKTGGGAGGELARKYVSTWKEWLSRANDKSAALRVTWTEAAGTLLANQPSLRFDLQPFIQLKFTDPDEKVRASMARALGLLDYETALHHVDRKVWEEVADRCADKKASVRAQAFDALGRIYRLARGELESYDPKAIAQFAWIPTAVLKASFTGEKEVRISVSATLDRQLLRLPTSYSGPDEDAKWVGRMLHVMAHLDESARKAFIKMTNLHTRREPFLNFVKHCEAYNGGIVDEDEEGVKRKLTDSIKLIAGQMAEPLKAAGDLHAFAKANQERTYVLLRTCLDVKTTLKQLIEARADLLKRVKEINANVVETIQTFLRMSSLLFVNRSSIPTLIRRLQQQPEQAAASAAAQSSNTGDETQGTVAFTRARDADLDAAQRDAQYLLCTISKQCPQILAYNVSELIKATAESGNEILAQEALRALAAVAAIDSTAVQMGSELVTRIARYASTGTPRQAKYAARLLAIVSKDSGKKTRDNADKAAAKSVLTKVESLAQDLTERLSESEGERLLADLSALGQIVKHNFATVIAAQGDEPSLANRIIQQCINDILSKPLEGISAASPEEEADPDEADDWIEDDAMQPDLRAKLLALDVTTKCCISYAQTDKTADYSKAVFKLHARTLATGQPREVNGSLASKSRMRLQASILILKMARITMLEKLIDREFGSVALLIQDVCADVRTRFMHKLLVYLRNHQLSPRFVAIPFLVAFDPEEENVTMVQNFARAQYPNTPADLRLKYFDVPFVRFLHLIAHHPDFHKDTAEQLDEIGRYIDFWLDCFANAQNAPLFYHLATRLKGVRDSVSQVHSENLYVLSELAQLYIKLRAQRQGWTLSSYLGKITLPSDIFRAQPNLEVQKQVYERAFIPEATVAEVTELWKNHQAGQTKRRGPQQRKERVAKAAKPKAPKKKVEKKAGSKRKRARGSDDEEEDEDEEDASSDAGDESDLSSAEEEEPEIDEAEEAAEGRGARSKLKERDAIRARNARKRAKKAERQAETESPDKENEAEPMDVDEDAQEEEEEEEAPKAKKAATGRPKPKPRSKAAAAAPSSSTRSSRRAVAAA